MLFLIICFNKRVQGVSMPIQRTTIVQASIYVKNWVCAVREFSWNLCHL